MGKSYKCVDGDRIDLIVFDAYGTLEPLPQVLAANVHLSKMPLVLESGTDINLLDWIIPGIKSKKIDGELW